jgi:hypothetical protein
VAKPLLATGRTYIGIDNGVSGSIGIIPMSGINARFHHTPTFSTLDYTKEKKNITRIDHEELKEILVDFRNPFAFIERPMVNPGRFAATASALRAMESTLIALDTLAIPYRFIDSQEWQKAILPKGIKGADNWKRASLIMGKQLFPQFKNEFKSDADGLLIAEWARRCKL